MHSNVSVDVLITFYNQKDCVERTLNSILSQQTEYPINIIIGDDGSTDGTVEKLKEWSEKYDNISYFVMDRDMSVKYEAIERVSALRKTLLTCAKSKYLLFLDGDDYYVDCKKIDKQVKILEERPECVCCAHNFNLVWESNDDVQEVKVFSEEGKLSNKKYWSSLYTTAMCFMVRNVTNGTIPEQLKDILFDDNSISLFFLQYGDLYVFPEAMCNYVQAECSSWNDRGDVEKYIINATDYYEEKTYAPKMKFWSLIRHSVDFIVLYKNRKSAAECVLNPVWSKKMNDYGKDTILNMLLNYDKLSCFRRIKVLLCYLLCHILIRYKRLRNI